MTVKKKPDYQKLGKSGGKACLAKYGKSHYSKLAKLSWKKRKAIKKS